MIWIRDEETEAWRSSCFPAGFVMRKLRHGEVHVSQLPSKQETWDLKPGLFGTQDPRTSQLLATSPCREWQVRKKRREFAWDWQDIHIILKEKDMFLTKNLRTNKTLCDVLKNVMFYKPDWCWLKKSEVINNQKNEYNIVCQLCFDRKLFLKKSEKRKSKWPFVWASRDLQGKRGQRTCTGTVSCSVSFLFYFLPLTIPLAQKNKQKKTLSKTRGAN